MSDKMVDTEAYREFLLSSPIAEVFSNKIFANEILAQAILSVLEKHNIVDHFEVTKAFDEIFKARFSSEIDIHEGDNVPDEFLVDSDDLE